MDEVIRSEVESIPREKTSALYQGYQVLHWGFVALPTIAGLDKFVYWLTNWDQYLAPVVAKVLPFSAHTFMMIVGVVEIIAALIVAVKPKIGGYIVALWLGGIVVNLILARGYLDIALRDFGLALGAVALARMSELYDRPLRRKTRVRSVTS
jgi:hypothetical protein